jgi:ABC-2 type transport system permease protein
MKTLTIGASRGRLEIRQFFREKDTVFFTFSFPIIMLVLLGISFRHTYPGTHITVAQVYSAALIGAGIMGVSFQNLGTSLCMERRNGTLKRLRGTPMPLGAYFVGKMLQIVIIALGETCVLLVMSMLMYGVRLPHALDAWLTFAWVFCLGIVSSSLLAIGVARLAVKGQNSIIVITMPFIILEFISGVFIPFTELPSWMTTIASVFPLAWMTDGFRSALLGPRGVVLERSGSYQLGWAAVVLAAWCACGFVLCLRTFRWSDSRTA